MIKNTMPKIILMIIIAGFVLAGIAGSASAAGDVCPVGTKLVVIEKFGSSIKLELTVTPAAVPPDPTTPYRLNGILLCNGEHEIDIDEVPFGQFLAAALETNFIDWEKTDFRGTYFIGEDLERFLNTECVFEPEYYAKPVGYFKEELDESGNRVAVTFKVKLVAAVIDCQ